MNMNCKHVTLLVLVDLSAAFATVDHDICLLVLSQVSALMALPWTGLRLILTAGRTASLAKWLYIWQFRLPYGVSQGSCLGTLLFTIYSTKLFEVIKNHLPQAHAYADDTQLYRRLVLTRLLIRLMQSLPWSDVYWTFVRGCLRISSNLIMIKLNYVDWYKTATF